MSRSTTTTLLTCALFALLAARSAVADPAAVDYVLTPLPGPPAPPRALPMPKYRFMFGDPSRWPGEYRWRYNPANAPGGYAQDLVVSDLRRTLDTWTQVCGVRHVYEGLTTTAPNTVVGGQPDYANVVGWGELDDGTAGVTYAWYRPGTGVRDIVDADVILSPSAVRNTNSMDRTGRHEWGHALGLAHSDRASMLMSGPPATAYSNLGTLQYDDVRGCRCLYGAPAGTTAGYACGVPASIDLGDVPIGAPSASHVFTLANDGNGPLDIATRSTSSGNLRAEGGCEAGSSVAPGSSCTIRLVATARAEGTFTDQLQIGASDGPYFVSVRYRGSAAVPAERVDLVEYFHPAFGHYFVTSIADEIRKLDDGTIPGWQRTALTMRAWARAQSQPPTVPVCRFFSARFAPKSSHFYTASAQECAGVKGNADWQFEGEVYHVALPDGTGACPAGTQAIYRLYNNGLSGAPNHRFTTDAALRSTMIGQGWTPEGAGLGVTMCGTQ